ncbi:MAG: NADH-quinone oxidoreductase subunit G [Gammaproteobacteria bacterium]|nr:NADH-quinone oxidoreductase subunit G [Gammaproteobacteria bacterium]
MSDNKINIEINGQALTADQGDTLIEIADKAGIRIPRFCYHNKLSVAANCRMCLVEVEKAPKPLPACATPVMDGMKVFTKSPKAIAAQKATMEFLLINHPLDCPICDQGGECELQDVAMGYGGDVSHYSEGKRVVLDKNLGALIATDMTRCIHCTRCVRFGQELAGMREMGSTGRGEHTRIGTYIEQAVDSEMSGNIIDLCPVGALTAKPSRYSARAWELVQKSSIAAHDCMGSNLYNHTFRGTLTRAVPRDNESINECWLSDRDRFSYEGINSKSRLTRPMIRVNGNWKETSWDTALELTAKELKSAGSDLGMLVSPNSTLEEMSLMRQVASGLDSSNIDHRLRQVDFRQQSKDSVFPSLGQSIDNLESQGAVLLIGSNVRKEQPIAAHRLRKASMNGAKIMFVNVRDFDFHFNVAEKIISAPDQLIQNLAGIAKAVLGLTGATTPTNLQNILANANVDDSQLAIAEHLKTEENSSVILGLQAQHMPYLAEIRALASTIAQTSNSSFGYLTDGANTSGAWQAGILPEGLNAQEMITKGMKAFVLLGVEPDFDVAEPELAVKSMMNADFVVSLTAYVSDAMKDYASVLLPVSPVAETSGTFINVAGDVQSFEGVTQPQGEARPAWKVLRVLGNLLDLDGFDYISSQEIRDEELARIGSVEMNNFIVTDEVVVAPDETGGLMRVGGVATYHEDATVRRAGALQNTKDANQTGLRINSLLASKLKLDEVEKVLVRQSGEGTSMTLIIDDGIPDDCVWVPMATPESAKLGSVFATIELEAD